ncbi:hypothetical protein Hanom_Chr02g00170541 [Helianthus anomalus]
MQVSGNGVYVEAQGTGNDGGAEKLPGSSSPKSHADPSPLHGENAISTDNLAQERENCRFGVQGFHLGSKVVGPEVVGGFNSGSGEKVGRPRRRVMVGQRSLRTQVHSSSNKSVEDSRPKKRSRCSVEDVAPGFGFVGFTSNLGNPLDLNTRAPSAESQEESTCRCGEGG